MKYTAYILYAYQLRCNKKMINWIIFALTIIIQKQNVMNYFYSIKDLLNVLSRGSKLLAEMFEKRKTLSYKYEYALEVMDGNEDVIKLLISRNIIHQNGNLLELDDQYLNFFEDILEVNEEINTSYVHESIRQIKEEYMIYYLQASGESERYRYLKAVKSSLKKIGRVTIRSIVDLDRNIENAFKTEPNYRIKLSKLENYKKRLEAIQEMIVQTEKLLNEDEITFFKTATDEELRHIKTDLLLILIDASHNLIETRQQIIEYINQVKYQNRFIEKLRQLKYLRNQYEIKHKTNIQEVLGKSTAVVFDTKPVYSPKLSLDRMQQDDTYSLIHRVIKRYKTDVDPKKSVAPNFSAEELTAYSSSETHINLHEVRDNFVLSDKHLFAFLKEYNFPMETTFDKRVTLYCQIVSIFEDELEITERYEKSDAESGKYIEYALVYPKNRFAIKNVQL